MEMTDPNSSCINKRSGKDRRAKGGPKFRSLIFGGCRENVRRREDTKKIVYVDRYSSGLFFTIISILFLCVIDALLTLLLSNQGNYKINPVMAYFLDIGPYTFFISKYLLTIIPTIFLLIYSHMVIRIIKVSTRSVLYLIAVFYLTVVVFQIYMVSNLAYSPDRELGPKVLTDTMTVCKRDFFNHDSRDS